MIFLRVWGLFGGAILNLAGQDIAYQLSKLDGIAGSLQALGCHGGRMPRPGAMFKARLCARNFKLYHYQAVLFLASEAASAITGVLLPVDMGEHLGPPTAGMPPSPA